MEHLAMGGLKRRRFEHNASVDLTMTEFTATGTKEQVLGFVTDVCASLMALPLQRLETEVKVLEAEGGSTMHPSIAEHLFHRYGLRGVGLALVSPPALDQVEPEQVRDYAASGFTQQNCVLVLTSEPPADFDLALPPGRLLPVPIDVPLATAPWTFESEGPEVSVSFGLVAQEPAEREAALTVLRIALERAEDELRHQRGWLYDVDFQIVGPSDDAIACFRADPPAAHACDVRDGLLRILRDLADRGPTSEELAADREAAHQHLQDPRGLSESLSECAAAHLRGRQIVDVSARLALRDALTAEDCRSVLRRVETTLVVGMPADTELAGVVPPVRSNDSADVVEGTSFGRSHLAGFRFGVPRGTRAIIGERGITVTDPEGPNTVLWDDVVGLAYEQDGESLDVLSYDGGHVPFDPVWFKDGHRAQALIEQYVPPHLRFIDRTDPSETSEAGGHPR
ncbi:hypothetical protein ACFQDO_09625 [Angustibacter luteus]|uniref:Peptidase M24 domain-containing protein n=2 Tax=Angustibacter luteus TaxID=658456 RepID=A0ABW1JET3_9ACTN